jgi:hypothetical protein
VHYYVEKLGEAGFKHYDAIGDKHLYRSESGNLYFKSGCEEIGGMVVM